MDQRKAPPSSREQIEAEMDCDPEAKADREQPDWSSLERGREREEQQREQRSMREDRAMYQEIYVLIDVRELFSHRQSGHEEKQPK